MGAHQGFRNGAKVAFQFYHLSIQCGCISAAWAETLRPGTGNLRENLRGHGWIHGRALQASPAGRVGPLDQSSGRNGACV